MHWRWPRFWLDPFRGFRYAMPWEERRNIVVGRIEEAGFGWWIVIVAGLGFLTDAYSIFAINTVVPMLAAVYWEGAIPSQFQLGLNVATLCGSMLGQVTFGVLADIYGRRKMYGLELIVTIVGSLGFAMSSPGVNNSMSMIGWLVFFRLLTGVGIGADYPLSAVITAEFAPTRYRARMVAAVFFCQPVGQLLATLFALAVTEGFRKTILKDSGSGACSMYATEARAVECARTIDRAWRLVSGLGLFPAALAFVSRLTIPESVYWTLDVKNDSNQAMQTSEYWAHPSTQGPEGADVDSFEFGEFPSYSNGNMPGEEAPIQDNTFDPENQLGIAKSGGTEIPPPVHVESLNPSPGATQSSAQMIDSSGVEDPHPREQSMKDFFEYLFGSKGKRDTGNWLDLLATSLNWWLLDFAFYLLNVNSAHIIPNMFATPDFQAPYAKMFTNEWHTLVATSVGAVLGGAIAVKMMNKFSRKKIQMWGFWVLGFLFLLLGILYITMLGRGGVAVIVTVYVLCQLVFNIGPNTTTFIVSLELLGTLANADAQKIPAEAFPTRYRCTCHGISAASGKFGSVIGQIAITKLVDGRSNDKRVGKLLIAFIVVMVSGALVTKYLTPETCDIWGKSRTLQELSQGRLHRKALEATERAQATQRGRRETN